MFERLKLLLKIGTVLRKVYNWLPAIIGGSVGLWELLGNAPGVLVMVLAGYLLAVGVGRNVSG